MSDWKTDKNSEKVGGLEGLLLVPKCCKTTSRRFGEYLNPALRD